MQPFTESTALSLCHSPEPHMDFIMNNFAVCFPYRFEVLFLIHVHTHTHEFFVKFMRVFNNSKIFDTLYFTFPK